MNCDNYTEQIEKLKRELDAVRKDYDVLRIRNEHLEKDNKFLLTMKKNIERRMLDSTAKNRLYLHYSLFLKNCQNIIFLFDNKLCLVLYTKVCAQFLPNDRSTRFAGLPIGDVFGTRLADDWVERLRARCEASMSTNEVIHYNDKLPFINGSHMNAQMTLTPVCEGGECRGVLISINDVTDIVRLKERAEDIAHAKSNFLAHMSHEIRTPMNAVKGLSELLTLTVLDSVQKRYVSNILKSSDTLLQIINDILDFSKIDANKIEIVESTYSPVSLIDEVLKLAQVRADEKGLTIITAIDPNIPSCLRGDDMRVKQVLMNILSNAVKYTQEGHIKVAARAVPVNGSKVELSFSVSDTGIGIKEEEKQNLFQAFSRLDLSANKGIVGTGLGLAISKQLVGAMGGDMSLESTYGVGSTFTFWMSQGVVGEKRPIAEIKNKCAVYVIVLGDRMRVENRALADMLGSLGAKYNVCESSFDVRKLNQKEVTHCIYNIDERDEFVMYCKRIFTQAKFTVVKHMYRSLTNAADTVLYHPITITMLTDMLNDSTEEDHITELYGGQKGFKYTTQNVKALLVDDNEVNRILGKEMLGVYDIDVDTAENGEMAVESCLTNNYDIIFMDHLMPVMDGIEATRLIREYELGKNIHTPIIALTANAISGMREFFITSQMDDYISKPIDVTELDRVLSSWLPADKIHARTEVIAPSHNYKEQLDVSNYIAMLDAYGVYASNVVSELNGNILAYMERIVGASKKLPMLVKRLESAMSAGQWDEFSVDIGALGLLLYNIGVREYLSAITGIKQAAADGKTSDVKQEFAFLKEDIYILEKKLEVLEKHYAHSADSTNLPPLNDHAFLRETLRELKTHLEYDDVEPSRQLLDKMMGLSVDRELDVYLKIIKNTIDSEDYLIAMLLVDEVIKSWKVD